MNWIKHLALCLPLTLLLVGCTPKEASKTEMETETTETVDMANPPAESTTETAPTVTEETKTTETKTEEAPKE